MSTEEILLLAIAIFITAILFYISASIIGHDWSASGGYVLRLLVVSLIAVVVIPVFSDALREIELGDLGLLFAFVLLVVIVRYLIVDELIVTEDWLASMFIAFVAVVMIFIVDQVAERIFDTNLLGLF
jgi:hypothetical protein